MIAKDHPLPVQMKTQAVEGFVPTHPDFHEWLDIPSLEDEALSVELCVEQMIALIEPKPLTEEMRAIIKDKI